MLILGRRGASRGFTIIEMMVAMALGLILTGAVTGLVVSSISNTNTTVQGMRVTEESRAVTEIITRELRRARYNASALNAVGSGATDATFAAITPTNVAVDFDCIKYSYDVNGDGDATGDTDEFRMFSRAVVGGRGVILFGRFDEAADVDCTDGDVITSEDIDVECLRFLAASADIAVNTSNTSACYSPVPTTPITLATIPAGSMYFSLRMSLQANGTTTATRRTDEMIMIRSPAIGP